MGHRLRGLLHSYVPSGIGNPFGLAWRLLGSSSPGARYALALAAGGIACAPLDVLLAYAEAARYRRAPPPDRPCAMVVGAPRSGTTLVFEVLVQHLEVSYLNNLSALFPRAPITADALLGAWLRRPAPSYRAFYGRAAGVAAPSDALALWDRWLGEDRTRTIDALKAQARPSLQAFFGAWQAHTTAPLVCKANRLDSCAHDLAKWLERSVFICLCREPLWLAQSLTIAREDIHGDPHRLYGVAYPGRTSDLASDPVEDVCRQVAFHERVAREQRERIGADRFWCLSYESFCERPGVLVERLAERLGVGCRNLNGLRPFTASRAPRLARSVLDALERRLAELGCGRLECDRD